MIQLIPDFGTDKDQLFDWLKSNKSTLLRQKKVMIKEGNAFGVIMPKEDYIKPDSNKEFGIVDLTSKDLVVKAAINTTNYIDSHWDLHLKKGWNRTVKHKANDGLHLKEHKPNFDHILADGIDQVKVYVTTMTWKSLGYNYEGSCDVLMHKTKLKAIVNPLPHQLVKSEMYYRYRDGEVKNHSVGMGYGEIIFCVNSEDKYWKEEKDNFDQYIEQAVNPEFALENGMFFAIPEMKYFEGSAVPRGSNPLTPTVSVTETKEEVHTQESTTLVIEDAPLGTQEKQQPTPGAVNLGEITKSILNLKNKK